MNLKRFFYLIILVSILLLCFSLTSYAFAAQAQSANSLFQHGNDLYGQGKYRQAVKVYSTIGNKYGVSGSLFYNLGNCYAQLGLTGKAILNYERALRLAPGNSDIQANLDLLRKNKGLFQEKLPWARRIVSFFDLNQWTLLAGISLVIFTLICLAGLRFKNGKNFRLWAGGFCLILICAAVAGAVFQYRQLDEAVVINDGARLLISPFTHSESIGTLKDGRIVRYISQHGSFSLVEDQAGRNGWIKTGEIESIGEMGVQKLLLH